MKQKHLWKVVVAFVLCVAMVLPFVPVTAEAQEVNNFNITNFKDLNFSLIGDSISTYAGVNNSATYNPDYYEYDSGDGVVPSIVYYTEGNSYGVTRADTWWQQTVDTLGMNLLVNNAWSGSAVLSTKGYTEGAYLRRSAYLHNGSTKPDIIAMYLGTNDCSSLTSTSTMGTVNSTLFSNAEAYVNGTRTTAPTTILEAYAIMLYRAMKAYPNAEIYCFTLLPKLDEVFNSNKTAYADFNAGVAEIVEHYSSEGVYLVDLFNDSGVHTDKYSRVKTLANNLHPNAAGMDAITNCLISSMIKNSKYMDTKGYSVTYDLANTYVTVGNNRDGEVMYGDVTAAVPGKPFSVEFYSEGLENIEYKVTMGGKDITHEAVRSNVLYIDKVTGDIEITAHDFDNFYWTAAASNLTTNLDQGSVFSSNPLTKQSTPAGTYTKGDNGGTFDSTGISYKMSEPINLLHDRPWVLEFEVTGSFGSGILLFSYYDASGTKNNVHIFRTATDGLLGLGFADGSYEHYGVGLESDVGLTDVQTALHTYRLYNVVNSDGTNTVYISVDDGTAHKMIQHYDAATDSNTTANEFSGRDIIFNYMGTSNHPLRNCTINWVKVYENGEPTEDEVNNFRWAGIGDSLTSAEDDGFFTENIATLEMGSGVNGVHEEESYYSLEDPIHLRHNRPWTVEIKAKGDWGARANESPMVFSTVNNSGTGYPGAIFLWRNAGGLLAFGYNQGYNATGTSGGAANGRTYGYNNYGINLADLNLSYTEYYVYRLQNEITYNDDGSYKSNMVYLYLNDQKIGAMNNYYQNGYSTDTTSDWLNGKDMVFSYMGNKNFPISGVTIDYIQVWENGYTVDTHRLQYLINNQLAESDSYNSDAWTAYKNAIDDAKELLKKTDLTQDKVEAAVDAIMSARNQLVTTYTGTTKIYSAELVTGEYARLGKQTGIKVITTPDVAQVCVGSQTLIVNSCKIQTLLLDTDNNAETAAVETEAKVWLVSFNYSSATEGKVLDFGIGAWKTYDSAHKGTSGSNPDAYFKLEDVKYTANYVTDIQISEAPTKTEYRSGDEFDPTGMVVQIKRKNSTDWETVTDYQIVNPTVSVSDQYVTVEYEGASARYPITVVSTVDEM